MANVGRPSAYNQEIAETILSRLAAGESLRKICEPDEMPAASTVCGWAASNPAFSEQYARARDIQSEILVEECRDLADKAAEAPTTEKVQAAKLQIEQRRWQAGKQQPKKYGDKLLSEHSGPNGGPILLSLADQIRGASTDG
jgi:hypothetical protein